MSATPATPVKPAVFSTRKRRQAVGSARRSRSAACSLAFAAALVVSPLGTRAAAAAATPDGAGRTSGEGQKSFTAFDAQAKALLAKMTLDEKIGQMIQPDQRSPRTTRPTSRNTSSAPS